MAHNASPLSKTLFHRHISEDGICSALGDIGQPEEMQAIATSVLEENEILDTEAAAPVAEEISD